MTAPKRCKDCPPDAKRPRPAIFPGPRCATHHRAAVRRTKNRAHERRIETSYTITAVDYWAIYQLQGCKCALCQVATGRTRRLAVDHDHELAKTHDHPVDQGCRLCIRGLLCKRCNTYGVPLNPAALVRGLNYLANPPARQYFQMKGIA